MPSKDQYWMNPEKYRAKSNAYRKDNPEWKRESSRRWAAKKRLALGKAGRAAQRAEAKTRNPAWYLLHTAHERAKKQGLPFDITAADIVIPPVCPVLGLPFEWGKGRMGWRNMRAPSLDRIKPQLGYVRGNVQVISIRANHVKGNATISEMEAVLAYMKRVGANGNLDEQEQTVLPLSTLPDPAAAQMSLW